MGLDLPVLWICGALAGVGLSVPVLAAQASDATQEREPFTQDLTFDAATLYQQGTVRSLALTDDGQAVRLDDHHLIEDDSPGAGVAVKADGTRAQNFDLLTPACRIRKTLVLDNAEAESAILSFYARTPQELGVPLRVFVNGHEARFADPRAAFPEAYRTRALQQWFYLPASAEALRAGENHIVIAGTDADHPWKVFFSESRFFQEGAMAPGDRFRGHSAKSEDGGKTWRRSQLGVESDMEGEYNVRLCLNQHLPEGMLTSSVIDLRADLGAQGVQIVEPAFVDELSVACLDADVPDGARLSVEARCGNSPQYGPNDWTVWQSLDSEWRRLPGPFVQFRVHFVRGPKNQTPVLRGVTFRVAGRRLPAPGKGRIEILHAHNEKILRTSYPYEYEPFDAPGLVALRERYRLDLVVRPAQTEFEKILLLKDWAAQQFARKDLTGAADPPFPPWDANVILQGKGYFCLHHAVVFMQACLSLGIQCRHVQINSYWRGGHEVNEVWSNDYGKWIFIDAGNNCYLRNPATHAPLSVREAKALFRAHQDKQALVEIVPGQAPIPLIVSCARMPNVDILAEPSPKNRGEPPPQVADGFVPFLDFFRIIPRNNMLSQPTPLPLHEGTSHWPWDGYICWAGPDTPRLPQYSRFTYRPHDMYWTLNQTHYVACYGRRAEEIVLQFDTHTPDFDAFLVRRDHEPWVESSDRFTWRLHKGENQLAVRTRNRAGNLGIASELSVSFR